MTRSAAIRFGRVSSLHNRGSLISISTSRSELVPVSVLGHYRAVRACSTVHIHVSVQRSALAKVLCHFDESPGRCTAALIVKKPSSTVNAMQNLVERLTSE